MTESDTTAELLPEAHLWVFRMLLPVHLVSKPEFVATKPLGIYMTYSMLKLAPFCSCGSASGLVASDRMPTMGKLNVLACLRSCVSSFWVVCQHNPVANQMYCTTFRLAVQQLPTDCTWQPVVQHNRCIVSGCAFHAMLRQRLQCPPGGASDAALP
jgi:hypothetical protein